MPAETTVENMLDAVTQEITEAGTGKAVDFGDASEFKLFITVTEYSSGTLVVFAQDAAENESDKFADISSKGSIGANGTYSLAVTEFGKFVRFRWTLSGAMTIMLKAVRKH